MSAYIEATSSKLDWAMPFQRTGGWPIDRSTMFESLADATKYAAGDSTDPDIRGLCGTSYIGQIITVYEDDVVTVYKIAADRTLAAVGDKMIVDDGSISYNEAGELQIANFDGATAGMQLTVVDIGTADEPKLTLRWSTPDTTTVEGLSQSIDTINGTLDTMATTISGKADSDSVYTKNEIDGKLTGALHYKGTYASYDALLAAVTAEEITPAQGDVYNITAAGGNDANGTAIKAGDNVVWNGEGWDAQSGTVDLSAYATTSALTSGLAGKVDVVEGSRLLTSAEATAIAGITVVEASETNGNIKIDDTETTVYTLPTASTTEKGGVVGSSANNQVAVGTDGTMTVNTIESSKISGVVTEAARVSKTLTIGEVTFDGSADATVTAENLPLPTDLVYTDDIATATSVGVVKGSVANNQVAVGTDGTMTVNTIESSKISGVVTEAAKVSKTLTMGDKVYDGSADVVFTADDVPVPTNIVTNTDYATATVGGVVKSSEAKNQVAVGTDGLMTVNEIDGSKISGAVALATNATKLGEVAATDILVLDTDGTTLTSMVKSAATAAKLTTARTIALSGDATGSNTFDGTQDISISLTLASLLTAGTFTKLTVNAKGLVTAGTTLEASDIPTLTASKISDLGELATKSSVAAGDLDSALLTRITDLEGASHSHENKTTLDSITSTNVTNWNAAVTAVAGKADAATTLLGYGIVDAYTKTEVDGIVSSALYYKGSYDTFALLTAAVTNGDITPAEGHVYNINTAGGTDINGHAIEAGDNVVWNGEGWDVLGGTVDLSAYALTEIVNAQIALKADTTTVEAIDNRLGTVESTVGDSDSGLVATVASHTTTINSHTSDISTLQTTVGSSTSGLVKSVADNTTAIATLNGTSTTEGSVAKAVSDATTTINTSINDITKEGGTIDTSIAAHNTATDAHSDLFAAKQNKAFVVAVTIPSTAYAATASTNTAANYVGTVTVSALTASKTYTVSAAPAMTSCAAVAAANFLPFVEVEDGVLSVYCNVEPTDDIVINCTFMEIQ